MTIIIVQKVHEEAAASFASMLGTPIYNGHIWEKLIIITGDIPQQYNMRNSYMPLHSWYIGVRLFHWNTVWAIREGTRDVIAVMHWYFTLIVLNLTLAMVVKLWAFCLPVGHHCLFWMSNILAACYTICTCVNWVEPLPNCLVTSPGVKMSQWM